MSARDEQIGINEALFREVNERIEDLSRTFGNGQFTDFICECGNADCAARLQLTVAEYEAVREKPTRFVVVSDHVVPDIERVVAKHDRYTVVEKVDPEAAEAAESRDPRS